MRFPVTEHVVKSDGHTTWYLACGAPSAPLIVFVHGWPELSISWRHQLRCFADLGFRAVAPDMRGYGGSTVHLRLEDYAMEPIVGDLLALLRALGREQAVWVGHDWGAPAVWSLAQHHPERALAVASLCVPYQPRGFTVDNLIPTVNRERYPLDEYPAGQWDYQLFYRENFDKARATFEANPLNTAKALFRKGNPDLRNTPARTATVRRDGGWFGGAAEAPDVPVDRDLLTDEDLHRYASSLARNGFFGPGAWYMNGDANAAYARRARNEGRLDMPVLFLHASRDYTCDTTDAPLLVAPMREACRDLTEATLPTGHWMAQERPELVNANLARWLAAKLPQYWRTS
ncbi:alpha/beta fold hydrolase [Ramlibacter albus]|uniref:Alpha/beta hydrolase n=1 Tax=Ramlibacter albus TaxID=2079448 RepID=A0A923MDZ9_9BURK|nr:alpha/beta hydrolase [Ramlibacter albus]MBC5767694.1 alpha/beta hydrolase [Ramlibacter albus]